MAIGDQAVAAGLPIVPETGEGGKVSLGAQEINRTRDFIALLMTLIPANKFAAQQTAGISTGTGDPTGGTDGDIYFKIVG